MRDRPLDPVQTPVDTSNSTPALLDPHTTLEKPHDSLSCSIFNTSSRGVSDLSARTQPQPRYLILQAQGRADAQKLIRRNANGCKAFVQYAGKRRNGNVSRKQQSPARARTLTCDVVGLFWLRFARGWLGRAQSHWTRLRSDHPRFCSPNLFFF
ncbi:hypothetical protein T440DRAFT_42032 [Plenodomus tracheiphilus IPT5]|uniref:Uncharacterized protein n=1 Tax=Plenodomus tracheiphilus IPT5 TaxID=1408161 RepID=A0A6A7BA53_9PLEO|nr:hypothetical protein T440DRAFT_42032 [Plenodomus tracheiphilus IPT5]